METPQKKTETPQKKVETPQLNQVFKIRKRLKKFSEMTQKYWEIPQKYWEIPQKYLSGEKRKHIFIRYKLCVQTLGFACNLAICQFYTRSETLTFVNTYIFQFKPFPDQLCLLLIVHTNRIGLICRICRICTPLCCNSFMCPTKLIIILII